MPGVRLAEGDQPAFPDGDPSVNIGPFFTQIRRVPCTLNERADMDCCLRLYRLGSLTRGVTALVRSQSLLVRLAIQVHAPTSTYRLHSHSTKQHVGTEGYRAAKYQVISPSATYYVQLRRRMPSRALSGSERVNHQIERARGLTFVTRLGECIEPISR